MTTYWNILYKKRSEKTENNIQADSQLDTIPNLPLQKIEILIFIRTLSLRTLLLYEAGFLCGQNRCKKTLLSIYI